MNSTVFKYRHHYQQHQQQQQQQQQQQHFNKRSNNNNQTSNGNNCGISSHNNSNNNNNQNSIFILNTATNNILPSNHQLYYSDLNESHVAPLSLSSSASASASASAPSTNSAAASSVWSSASSQMCSPAAHALQKLFSCSSASLKFNHGCNSGIESKSKSEILKKKSKFWKYLEDEDNDKNNQKGVAEAEETDQKLMAKGSGARSFESDNRNQEDLSELLEYSCSLCDNCRCVDCQIGYFDCENSDDSNSEYSFHLSAYEEDEDVDNSDEENVLQRRMELKSSGKAHNCCDTTFENCCAENDVKQLSTPKLDVDFELPSNCCTVYCVDEQQNCTNPKCCQQCFIGEVNVAGQEHTNHLNFTTSKNH